MRIVATKYVTILAKTQKVFSLAASAQPMVMDLMGAAVATAGAMADVDGPVGKIQAKLPLAQNVSICLLHPLLIQYLLKQQQQHQGPLQLRHRHPLQPHHRRHHRRPDQIPICRKAAAVRGPVRMRLMSVVTAQLGARPMLPIAHRVKVIGLVLSCHAQHHPLLHPFQQVAAARGQKQGRLTNAARAHLGARQAPAIAARAMVIGSFRT